MNIRHEHFRRYIFFVLRNAILLSYFEVKSGLEINWKTLCPCCEKGFTKKIRNNAQYGKQSLLNAKNCWRFHFIWFLNSTRKTYLSSLALATKINEWLQFSIFTAKFNPFCRSLVTNKLVDNQFSKSPVCVSFQWPFLGKLVSFWFSRIWIPILSIRLFMNFPLIKRSSFMQKLISDVCSLDTSKNLNKKHHFVGLPHLGRVIHQKI